MMDAFSKQGYFLFDFLKVFLALFVIVIHCDVVKDITNPTLIGMVNLFESIAVPVFSVFR